MQLLTGFLLTLPFQQKFSSVASGQRAVYLATGACSIVATVFLQAPVVVHRFLFRRHRRAETVRLAHRLAFVGIFMLGWAVIGVSCLIPAVLSISGSAASSRRRVPPDRRAVGRAARGRPARRPGSLTLAQPSRVDGR